jgi:hypothetical protein
MVISQNYRIIGNQLKCLTLELYYYGRKSSK